MDFSETIEDLCEERALVEKAIAILEGICIRKAPRRGRPPKWLTAQRSEVPTSEVNAAVVHNKSGRKRRADQVREAQPRE